MSLRDRMIIAVLACVVACAGFWFAALKPKRAEATAADARAAAAQARLDQATATLAQGETAKKGFEADYATIARLGKAVPNDDDAASLVFQIETAARKAKIDFRSLTVGGDGAAPAAAESAPAQSTDAKSGSTSSSTSSSSASAGSSASAPATGSAAASSSALAPGVVTGTGGVNRLPFQFKFDGDYFSLTRLLDLLRGFTTTKGDAVQVRGRLLDVQSVKLEEGRKGFPQVTATISATAYLAAEPVTLPGGATAPAVPAGADAAPATTTAPSTQAASTKSSIPAATVIPGVDR
jgi:hypothetical protein